MFNRRGLSGPSHFRSLSIGGGIFSVAGGATFVGADIIGNKLIQAGIDEIQTELKKFYEELNELAKFDPKGLLVENVNKFGQQLLELESLTETGFITFLENILNAVTNYVRDGTNATDEQLKKLLSEIANEANMKAFMNKYIMPYIKESERANLSDFISHLKFLVDGATHIYKYITLLVQYMMPLNKVALPAGAIAKFSADGLRGVMEVGKGITKISPRVLKGLGYAAGGIAIVVDLGFLIHTCVTMNDPLPHVEKLRSLADQMEQTQLFGVSNPSTNVELVGSDETSLSVIDEQTDLESVSSDDSFLSCESQE